MMVSSSGWSVQKISSVMNGIYGCRSLRASVRTFVSVQTAASAEALFSSRAARRGLTISIYQSQNSSHRKSWIFWTAMPSSYLSMFSVTSFVTVLILERIQRSEGRKSFSSGSSIFSSGMFIMIKREAFQTLLAKFRLVSTCSQ